MGQVPRADRVVVLVVEDEPLLRLHAVDVIEEAGFEVVEAANADEAIVMLSARLDIRIVFTDIQMPGSMDGVKLAATVRDRWPPIDIVLTSGFVKLAAADIPDRGYFFSKPYNDSELIRTLRSFQGE